MTRQQRLINIIETYEQKAAEYRAMLAAAGRPGPAKLYSERVVELAYQRLEEIS